MMSYAYSYEGNLTPEQVLEIFSKIPVWTIVLYAVGIVALIAWLIVCLWKIFEQAGEPGWTSIVPFYSTYVLFKIAFGNGWMFLLCLIPIAGIVIYLVALFKLATSLGESAPFGIGMIFLPLIFFPLLAFKREDGSKRALPVIASVLLTVFFLFSSALFSSALIKAFANVIPAPTTTSESTETSNKVTGDSLENTILETDEDDTKDNQDTDITDDEKSSDTSASSDINWKEEKEIGSDETGFVNVPSKFVEYTGASLDNGKAKVVAYSDAKGEYIVSVQTISCDSSLTSEKHANAIAEEIKKKGAQDVSVKEMEIGNFTGYQCYAYYPDADKFLYTYSIIAGEEADYITVEGSAEHSVELNEMVRRSYHRY